MVKKTLTLMVFFTLIPQFLAAIPPPSPYGDVVITDSSLPDNDYFADFGEVEEGVLFTPDQSVTVTNNGNVNLNVSITDNLASPLNIFTEDCSSTSPMNGSSCDVIVHFAPLNAGDYFGTIDITYDDAASVGTITNSVYFKGRMITEQTVNKRPEAPVLDYPPDGDTDIPASVTFKWWKSTDKENEDIVYDLFVCEDQNFAGCPAVNALPISLGASSTNHGLYFMALGFVATGMILSSERHYRSIFLFLLAITLFFVFLASCGNGGGGGNSSGESIPPISYEVSALQTSTTYYWKVVAEDSAGNRTDSMVWDFTTQ